MSHNKRSRILCGAIINCFLEVFKFYLDCISRDRLGKRLKIAAPPDRFPIPIKPEIKNLPPIFISASNFVFCGGIKNHPNDALFRKYYKNAV